MQRFKVFLKGVVTLILGIGFILCLPLWINHLFVDQGLNQDLYNRITVRAYYPDRETALKTIQTFNPTPPEVNFEKGYLVLYVTPSDIQRLSDQGFRLEEYADYRLFHSKTRQLGIFQKGIPGYPCYPTVEETFKAAKKITRQYPHLAVWFDIGNSWEKQSKNKGYDLMVLKLTNVFIPGPKPILFINSAIHAREYTTTALALEFAHYLVQNYQSNADAHWILDYHEVHFLLQANPDGRKQAEQGKLWRKNTNENYCGPTSDKRGVDLNRNFDFKWGFAGADKDECSIFFLGPYPASEPETRAIQRYVKLIFNDYNGNDPLAGAPLDAQGLFIDLHSYSELVLWPWGYGPELTVNHKQLATLGRKFAFFNHYDPRQLIDLYPTSGATNDYVYGELGVAAFCFELGTAFFQSCDEYYNKILPDNLKALIYASKVASAPYQLAAGPDVLQLSIDKNSQLTAFIDDTRFNESNGTEEKEPISQVEYYIDIPPWQEQAVPFFMQPIDGQFDQTKEKVRAVVQTQGLSPRRHTIYVRAQDAAGNWGAVSAVFLDLDPNPKVNFSYQVNGLEVTFKDESVHNTATNISWLWSFGDGHFSNQRNPKHVYPVPGWYHVILLVEDDKGGIGIKRKKVKIKKA